MATVKQAYTAKQRIYNGTHGNLSAQVGGVKNLTLKDGDSLVIFNFDIGVRLLQLKLFAPDGLGEGVTVSAQVVNAANDETVIDVITENEELAEEKSKIDSDDEAYFPLLPDLQENTALVLTFSGGDIDKKPLNYIAYMQSVGNI